MKSTILKHLNTKITETIQPEYLDLNELLINFIDNNIYTKNQYNNVVITGDSLRKLSQFKEYYFSKTSNNDIYLEILKFKEIDNILRLTTEYPSLSITDILNVYLDKLNLIHSYLSIDDKTNLTNTDKYKFNLFELGDTSNILLNESVDGYAVTGNFNSNTNLVSNKDVFTSRYYGQWSLNIDSYKLSLLEDLNYNNSTEDYSVIQQAKEGVNNIESQLRTIPFEIIKDLSPLLSNNLDCDNYHIYNQIYNLKNIDLIDNVENIELNLNITPVVILNADNTNYISIILNVSSDFINNGYNTAVIILNNFVGALEFKNALVCYENGILPQLKGKINILQLIYYMSDSVLSVKLLHKGIDLE